MTNIARTWRSLNVGRLHSGVTYCKDLRLVKFFRFLQLACRERDRNYDRNGPRESSAERRAKIASWQAEKDAVP